MVVNICEFPYQLRGVNC